MKNINDALRRSNKTKDTKAIENNAIDDGKFKYVNLLSIVEGIKSQPIVEAPKPSGKKNKKAEKLDIFENSLHKRRTKKTQHT